MRTTVTFDGKYFGPGLGMGCWFKSKERAPLGEVRRIRGMLFYAYMHGREGSWLLTNTTSWVPVEDEINWPAQIQEFWSQLVAGNPRITLTPIKREQAGEDSKDA